MHRNGLPRRSFIATTSSFGAASLIPHTAVRAAEKPKGFNGFKNIELAIATICTDGFANQNHKPAMQFIRGFGFQNVELNLLYPQHMRPGYISNLKQRCDQSGLKPISIHSIGFGSQGGRGGIVKDVAHKMLMMQYAKQLNCNVVKFTGSKRGTQGGLESIIEVCKQLVPAAEEMGVLVTLENHVGNNLETMADYDRIFSAVDSPNIGMCLDTGHFEGVGIQLSKVVQRFHTRILHVDLKDCREFGKGHNTVPFGSGVTDFDAFLSQLIKTGYQGYLVVEQAWKEPQGDWKADLAASFQRFKKWETK